MDDLSSFQNNDQQQLNPWLKRKETGWLKAMWRTVKILLVRPQVFFKDFQPSRSIKEAYFFYLIAAISFTILFLLVIPCLSCLFFSKYLIFLTIFAILGSLAVPFVWAGLFHLFIKLCGGQSTYATTFQVTCYSFGATIGFSLIPYIGLTLTMFWSVFILIVGCSRVHRISAVRAAIALLIATSVLPLIKLGQEYQLKQLKAQVKQASEYLEKMEAQEIASGPFTVKVIDLADFPCLMEPNPNLQCVEQAVESGQAKAEYLLGVFYSNGIGVPLDFKKAEKLFLKAARQGFAQAQYKMGCFYISGAGRLSIREAADWDLKAAEQGLPQSQIDIADHYAYSIAGFPEDYDIAQKWYRKAAQRNYAWAQYALGKFYEDGLGGEPDFSKAARWYSKSADSGFSGAFYAIGRFHAMGAGGFPKDHAEAAKWYQKAAEYTDLYSAPYAQGQLGIFYEEGKVFPQDFTEAAKWYRQAALSGYRDAQYNLGRLLGMGKGVAEDKAEAAKWCLRAAEQGLIDAQHSLGLLYSTGEASNLPQDFEKAYFWLSVAKAGGDEACSPQELEKLASRLSRKQVAKVKNEVKKWKPKTYLEQMIDDDAGKAIPQFNAPVTSLADLCLGTTTPSEQCLGQAEQGIAQAQYVLGVLYSDGIGVAQDYAEAEKWYRKAAEQGHPLAQYNLAILSGAGLVSYWESTKWYYKAAIQGLVPAQLVMARRYDYGVAGLSENPEKAKEWYHRAAEKGLVPAQLNLGGLLVHSLDPQRRQEGQYWVERAANQGNTNAQLLLGHFYQSGKGGSRDLDKAYFWLSLALTDPDMNGWERRWGMVTRRLIFFLIPRGKIAQLDVQVRDWKPREE